LSALDDCSLSCADYMFKAGRQHGAGLDRRSRDEAVGIGYVAEAGHVSPSEVFVDRRREAGRLGDRLERIGLSEMDIDALLGVVAVAHCRCRLATEYVWSIGWDFTRVDDISERAIVRDQAGAVRHQHLGR
jgi:hypothetical protein